MTAKSLDAVLEVLLCRAPALRASGVRQLSVGDLSVELSPPDPEPAPKATATGNQVYVDPLHDPETYGSNGRVPGFMRDDLE